MIINKLNKLLKAKKVLQKDFCNAIGITPSGLRKSFEINDFKVSTLRKFSDFFNVPITYWFEDSEKNNFFLENSGNILSHNTVKEKFVQYGEKQPDTDKSNKIFELQHQLELMYLKLELAQKEIKEKNETIKFLKELVSKK
jgi:transcriptional regulator with XRE-family HTH domain